MATVEIRGSGYSFALFVDGQTHGTGASSYEKACIKANYLERMLARVDRPCLCCGATFTAAGRNNRMCPACTDFAAGAMI